MESTRFPPPWVETVMVNSCRDLSMSTPTNTGPITMCDNLSEVSIKAGADNNISEQMSFEPDSIGDAAYI